MSKTVFCHSILKIPSFAFTLCFRFGFLFYFIYEIYIFPVPICTNNNNYELDNKFLISLFLVNVPLMKSYLYETEPMEMCDLYLQLIWRLYLFLITSHSLYPVCPKLVTFGVLSSIGKSSRRCLLNFT